MKYLYNMFRYECNLYWKYIRSHQEYNFHTDTHAFTNEKLKRIVQLEWKHILQSYFVYYFELILAYLIQKYLKQHLQIINLIKLQSLSVFIDLPYKNIVFCDHLNRYLY